ncbi:MAG: DUF1294 domain-containing protein [Firmicutes bacterium]|nr:DUF1294 domain-containing protein [Bacillota bacterium]
MNNTFIYLALINILAFCIFGLDKQLARYGQRRIAEIHLFLLALVGGSVGALLGMYFFRHKTLHRRFTVGLPLILLLQIGLAIYMEVAK